MDIAEEFVAREVVFAWLRARMLVTPTFSRADLASVAVGGKSMRLVGTQTGIWKPQWMGAALSILTGYYRSDGKRRYQDGWGADELFRYKWRGTDGNLADNRWLRDAMTAGLPLVWFLGIGYAPGTSTQVFQPVFPVWLIAEEPEEHQFVVALEESQRGLAAGGRLRVGDIERRYNHTLAVQRLHQPLFRARVLHAYLQRCAVCRLPFEKLLDAAHIRADADGGEPAVANGLVLCKIHHGAFDANILGITPDYVVRIQESVLDTFDGPTLQHALKAMHGESLRQLPARPNDRPNRDLLEERYQRFRLAG